jgi:glutaminyl-tRNA synthetase
MPWALKPARKNSGLLLYDRLFADAGCKDFLQSLNADSLKVVATYVDPSLARAQPDQKFQFEFDDHFVAKRTDDANEAKGC